MERASRLQYSCSVLAYYFCLKGQVPGLLQHNVFLSEDYKGSWDRPCFPEDMSPERQLNFYVHNPSYTDTTTGAMTLCERLSVGSPLTRRRGVLVTVSREGFTPFGLRQTESLSLLNAMCFFLSQRPLAVTRSWCCFQWETSRRWRLE